MNNVFLDASVALEILFVRDKFDICLECVKDFDTVSISILTVHLAFHFAKIYDKNLSEVEAWIKATKVLDMNELDFLRGVEIYNQNDFEDALQISCFIRSGASKLLTLDKKMFNKYKYIKELELL